MNNNKTSLTEKKDFLIKNKCTVTARRDERDRNNSNSCKHVTMT